MSDPYRPTPEALGQRQEARRGGVPGATDTFQKSLDRLIDAHHMEMTDAKRRQQEAFQKDGEDIFGVMEAAI